MWQWQRFSDEYLTQRSVFVLTYKAQWVRRDRIDCSPKKMMMNCKKLLPLLFLPIISVHSLVPSTKSSTINKRGRFGRSLLQLHSSQPTSLSIDEQKKSKEHTTHPHMMTKMQSQLEMITPTSIVTINNQHHMHFTGRHYSNENIKIPLRNYNNDVNHTLDHNWRQVGQHYLMPWLHPRLNCMVKRLFV